MENGKACECGQTPAWQKKVMVPERVVQKINPQIFVNFLQPFMKELGSEIIKARMTGRGFILEASIRFPEFISLGEEKKEDGGQLVKP